eukprot:CAMPEP_0204909778 /NCGR_PEP_ID=MMETSP1397-20131031/8427_1 /ASSEMBLY_ACC=CAM_ASM_000891 /TAXON_ID=49980 /ORGANISM="Climacostomum Climacostomum virens, Strain Stock W-24" /LENGTH=147 /DNA_ID=CAMNT_0052079701 /DNA_START=188 /DNA_END=628 /DNA_ORIENTATION=+
MNHLKTLHASAYFEGFVYAIGGYIGGFLDACERYNVAEDKWEDIPKLPEPASGFNALVLEFCKCLYVFGGGNRIVQEFSLETLQWRVLEFTLMTNQHWMISFRQSPDSSKLFYIDDSTLYSFCPQDSSPTKVKKLASSNYEAIGSCS